MVKGRRDVTNGQPAQQQQAQQFQHDGASAVQGQGQQPTKGGGVGSTRVRDAMQWNPLAPEEKTSEEKVAEEKQNHGNHISSSPLEIKKKIQEERVSTMIEKSEKNLFSCKTFFPFDLFPDELLLDQLKITIKQHEFFYSEHTKTVLLSDIQNVTVSYAWFLARLVISQRNESSPVIIGNLKRKDAIRAKQLIQGIIVAKSENIPLAMLSEQEVVEKLEKLGE